VNIREKFNGDRVRVAPPSGS